MFILPTDTNSHGGGHRIRTCKAFTPDCFQDSLTTIVQSSKIGLMCSDIKKVRLPYFLLLSHKGSNLDSSRPKRDVLPVTP